MKLSWRAKSESETHMPLVWRFVLASLILGGIIPRTYHLGRSLWTGEAWVANSVMTDTLSHMFHYDAWLQTTPPLFLLLVRAAVGLFGLSDYTLRAVPFVLGILALVWQADLSRRMFRMPFALLGLSLVVLSPTAVIFAKELKQYSGDMAATCLILLLLWRCLEGVNRSRWYWLLCGFSVAPLLSYTAVVFIPLALIVLWIAPGSHREGARFPRVSRCLIFLVLVSIICICNYFFFIKPNSSPLLADFWKDGFPDWGSLRNAIFFYCEYFLGMGIYFFLPIHSKDTLKQLLAATPTLLRLLGLFVTGGAFLAVLVAFRRSKQYLHRLLFCVVPVVCLAALNIAHMYPVSSRRLTLFMLPCVAIGITTIVEAIWDVFLAPLLSFANGQRVLAASSVILVLVVFAVAINPKPWGAYQEEDTEAAFRYMKAHLRGGDSIYVHASIAEPARLYFRILGWQNPPVEYGHTGWPCCTRTPESTSAGILNSNLQSDFDSLLHQKDKGNLWLVFTGRSDHWQYLHRNEQQILTRRLSQVGCREDAEVSFTNEVVDEFRCNR